MSGVEVSRAAELDHTVITQSVENSAFLGKVFFANVNFVIDSNSICRTGFKIQLDKGIRFRNLERKKLHDDPTMTPTKT